MILQNEVDIQNTTNSRMLSITHNHSVVVDKNTANETQEPYNFQVLYNLYHHRLSTLESDSCHHLCGCKFSTKASDSQSQTYCMDLE